MAILALAGTLAFSFLLELIGASAANSSGWGIVGAIAAMGAFLIHTIEQAHKKRRMRTINRRNKPRPAAQQRGGPFFSFTRCVPIRGCGGLCGIGGRRGWR